ncbi:MAG: aspartate aminotransferase family protein [Clostridia bacterium]|nr:aspartate aminotransferase family protein [Clostridia bacterium]
MQKTDELLANAKNHILYTAARPDKVMEHGEGMYLWDTDGKCYLDFIGGWAVNCLGHSPEAISKALAKQASVLVNASPTFYNKPMIEFATLLTENSCFDRVFFLSSGAEANESAIKLARKYGAKHLNGAYEIITTVNGFHGRTLATMSATGKQAWKDLFAPKIPGFVHVGFNDIEAIKAAITPLTCAVMLEPVQGEGGVNPADEAYIRELRKICDEKGILLIFDEIQTGIGRLGNLFAYEQYGVEPDIMTLAKGIGGGFPLSAMLTKEKYNIFEAGDQGGTYSGQPLAMTVGYAVVSEVIRRNLPAEAKEKGQYIIKKLNEIKDVYGIKNIRGKGLLIGFDLPGENGQDMVRECLAEGLIVNSPKPSTMRLIPPLIVEFTHIDEMMDILCRVLDKVIR